MYSKCAKREKTESVGSFAIAILDALIDGEFPRLTGLYNELRFLLPCVHDCHS